MDRKTITAVLVLLAIQTAYAQQDYRKAVILDMTAREGDVTLDEVKVIYGVAPRFLPDYVDRESLKLVVRTDKDDLWWSRTIQNPRHCQIAGENLDENEPHYIIKDSNEFTAVIPFKRNLRTLTVYNYDNGEVMGSFDLSEAVNKFCRKQVYDTDCRGETPATGSTTASTTTSTTTKERPPAPTTTLRPQPPSVTGEGGGVVGGVLNFLKGLFR